MTCANCGKGGVAGGRSCLECRTTQRAIAGFDAAKHWQSARNGGQVESAWHDFRVPLDCGAPVILVSSFDELAGFLSALSEIAEEPPWKFKGAAGRMTIVLHTIAAPHVWNQLTAQGIVWTRRSWWRQRLPWEWQPGRKEQEVDNLFTAAWAAVVRAKNDPTETAAPKRLVTIAEAAKICHTPRKTLEDWKAKGKLPLPLIAHSGKRPASWDWELLRPALEQLTGLSLPKCPVQELTGV